jgi:hypothetical protein
MATHAHSRGAQPRERSNAVRAGKAAFRFLAGSAWNSAIVGSAMYKDLRHPCRSLHEQKNDNPRHRQDDPADGVRDGITDRWDRALRRFLQCA